MRCKRDKNEKWDGEREVVEFFATSPRPSSHLGLRK